jgi:hypothetical protein
MINVPPTLHKDDLVSESEKAFHRFTAFCKSLTDDQFFYQPAPGEWSTAQHLLHLMVSVKTATAAYALPKFLVRWIGGKPNRPSHTYDQLVAEYRQKLAEGIKLKSRYLPRPVKPGTKKDDLVNNWRQFTTIYLQALKKNWPDKKLDEYIVKHPVLGKITLRELCYFTIYNMDHHLQSVKKFV